MDKVASKSFLVLQFTVLGYKKDLRTLLNRTITVQSSTYILRCGKEMSKAPYVSSDKSFK